MKFWKRIPILLIVLTVLATHLGNPLLVSAQSSTDPITVGTTWLLSARYGFSIWAFDSPPDPTITEYSQEDFKQTHVRDTLEAILTLQTINNVPADVDAAIDFLQTPLISTTGQLSQRIQISSKAGRETDQDLSNLLISRNADEGFGGALGYPSNVLDTSLALQALAGRSNLAVVSGALNYLTSNQNPDGGWGFAKGQASQIYYTSLALLALKDFQPSFDVSASVIAGTNFLVAHQNANGSFGAGSGTPFETALGLQAMLRFVVDPAKRGAAVNHLLSTQTANGSWGDDPYSTALALRALHEAQNGDPIIDNDGDGFSEQQGDCNDADAAIHPGAADLAVDGIDQDCNGVDGPLVGDTDGDGDGFTVAQGDCNDTDANIYPGAFERPNDGIDQNCNGSDETASGSVITSARMFKTVEGGEIPANTFGAYESVRVEVILNNPDTLVWVIINNANGQKVLTVGNQTEGLGFNTLNFPPGDYTLTIVAYDGATFVVEEVRDLPFTIQPGFGIVNVILGILPEFTHVGAVETENLFLLLSNRSNVSAEVAVTYRIRTPSGAILNGGSVPLSLSPSAPSLSVPLATFNHTFTEAGEYPVEAQVFAGSELLATASSKIFVAPSIRIDPSKTITPQTIPPGENKQIQIDIRLEGVEQGP